MVTTAVETDHGGGDGPIVVTGAAGLLGRHVVAALARAGTPVVGTDIGAGPPPEGPAPFVVADLRSYRDAREVVVGARAVVHCAGLHAIHLGAHSTAEFFDNNVRSTFNVLQACEEVGVRTVVATSSTAVYGTAGDPVGDVATWIDEGTPRRWRVDDVYHATKVLKEDLCAQLAARTGCRVVALRCTRLCDGVDPEDSVRLLSQGVAVSDAAEAHRLAVDHAAPGYSVYNIGPPTGFAPSDLEALFRAPRAVLGELADAIERAGLTVPASIARVYDIGRARKELGYRPTVDCARTLASGWTS